MTSRQSKDAWQKRHQAAGDCIICGKPRGHDGTKPHCRKHAEIVNATCRMNRKLRAMRLEAQ